jgi:hypothetical protein
VSYGLEPVAKICRAAARFASKNGITLVRDHDRFNTEYWLPGSSLQHVSPRIALPCGLSRSEQREGEMG